MANQTTYTHTRGLDGLEHISSILDRVLAETEESIRRRQHADLLEELADVAELEREP